MSRRCAIAAMLCLDLLPVSGAAAEMRLIAAPMGVADVDLFGHSVSNAGDVNGDGYADIIVGAPGNDIGGNYGAGWAYVYNGGPEEVDTVADLVLTGAAAIDQFGISVSGAGDVNGDGYADVIVGAWGNDFAGLDAGRAYVYYGGPQADAVPDLTFTGAAANDDFGISVSGAGDVNGDGYADVIVGAYTSDVGGTNAGQAYVYYGGPAADAVADLILTGEAANNYFGYSVSSAGDVNGDGYGDVIVGAYGYGGGMGRAYVYYGGASLDEAADLVLTGASAEDYMGYSVSGADDVNGDGYADVITGAFGNDAGGGSAGRAYVYYGGPAADAVADLVLTGAAAIDQFGISVSGAGDVNGDGYADVIVGARLNDSGGTDAGRAYVYFGGPGADATSDLTLTGDAADDQFGISVSGAGDVDGDGYADVTVGAPFNDTGGFNAGSAYVYVANGSLSAPVVAAGSPATVTARLQFVAVVSATLYYRSGGAASFTPISMTESQSGDGTWTAAIPSGSVTARGAQYYVQALDFARNTIVLPAGAPLGGTASLGVSVTNYAAFSLAASPTYQLLGVPLVPANTSPASVFDELGGYDPSVWRYGTWDPATNSYKEHPNAASAAPGQGFWVISKDEKSIAISGVSTDVGSDFPIQLGPGFNQIANPFAFPVDFADVVRPASVEAQIFGWNGSAYVSGVGVMEPGKGYWVRNNGAGGDVIRIPPLGSGMSPAPPLALARRSGAGAGWSVRAAAYAGRFYDDQSRFGMTPGATDAKDATDFTHPPAPPDGYVGLSFLSDEGNRLLNDYRGESEGATWRVQASSDQSGEPLRLRFTPEGRLPDGLEVVAFEGRGAVEVDLLREPEIRSEVSRDGSREWTIVAGTRGYVESVREEFASQVTRFALGRAYPNPARGLGGVTLDFEAPMRTGVEARVYDVQGRLVRTVVDGVVERGVRRLRWDGQDQAGRVAAAGVYFVKLEASRFQASQKVLILR
jgi:hypothetical protein